MSKRPLPVRAARAIASYDDGRRIVAIEPA